MMELAIELLSDKPSLSPITLPVLRLALVFPLSSTARAMIKAPFDDFLYRIISSKGIIY